MPNRAGLFCILLCLLFLPTHAQGNDDSQSADGYKVDLLDTSYYDGLKLVYCNSAQYGDSIPYPNVVLPIDEQYFVIQGKAKWLPPDPGEAGKVTIHGIDSDHDCVRDDIERYIAKLLPKKENNNARNYLLLYGKWLGKFMNHNLSVDAARIIARNLYASAGCVRYYAGDNPETTRILDKVFSKFHNTFARSDRFIANNALLGGWNTREDITLPCALRRPTN